MMRFIKSPQYRTDAKFEYEIVGEVIVATLSVVGSDTISDTFDFTAFPDGELDVVTVSTSLPVPPILSANRIDGHLSVELLNYVDDSSTNADKYPEWVVV